MRIGKNQLRLQDLDLVDQVAPTITPPMTKMFRTLVHCSAVHLGQAKPQREGYVDASRRPLEFALGDKVRVSTCYMAQRGSPLFAQRHVGPFRIVARTAKVAHKLALPPSTSMHPAFDISLLSADRPRPQHVLGEDDWEPLEEAEDGLPIYDVENILEQNRP